MLLLNLLANLAKHIQRIIVRGPSSVKCYINIAYWSQSLECSEPLSRNSQDRMFKTENCFPND